MGCGSSHSYTYEVGDVWDQVSRTVDSTKRSSKLVIRRHGWKTIRIFVSSTFKDFHSEREVLVKEVRDLCAVRSI